LLVALSQEAFPIIVSASLLYNIGEYRQKDPRPIETLLNEMVNDYIDVDKIIDPMVKTEKEDVLSYKNDIAISKIAFDPRK